MTEQGQELARKLAWLRENIPKPASTGAESGTRQRYEIKEIAVATGISLSQLYKLFGGEIPNPGWQKLQAIAELFQVPLDYFADTEHGAAIREQLTTLAMLRDLAEEGVEHVSLRGLTSAQAERIRGVVEDLRESNATRSAGTGNHEDG